DFKEVRYANGLPIIGVKETWKLCTNQTLQTSVWLLEKPVKIATNAMLVLKLGNAEAASLRMAVSPFAADEPLQSGMTASARKALAKSGEHRKLLEHTFLLSTTADTNFLAETHTLQRELRECRAGRMPTQITEAREPLVTHVLPRGN